MAVAMMALEGVVHTSGPKGERAIPLNEFYLLPGKTPQYENLLVPGELITYVTIPKLPGGTRSYYLKRRDRASYEFALASAAVVANVQGGSFQHIRIALGGVGTKPWRSHEAERALQGKQASAENFRAAAEGALPGARPMHDNAFKVELAKRTLVRALQTVTQTA
jgi:xanthine dehydrogenase YagS FAD-binding subunit